MEARLAEGDFEYWWAVLGEVRPEEGVVSIGRTRIDVSVPSPEGLERFPPRIRG
jgi:hypothetical protein